MSVSDNTLAEWASRLSCEAMSDLSKGNYLNNLSTHMHALTEPSCEMAFGFIDRKQESLLQNGASISRNICVEKLNAYQRGPWEATFAEPAIKQPVHYDQWTRARLHTQCDKRTKNDCDCRLEKERFI